jgi:hypothetical protein
LKASLFAKPSAQLWHERANATPRLTVSPNPSLERTSSGIPRKPAVRQLEHRHTSGLRGTPPGSAQLERYASQNATRAYLRVPDAHRALHSSALAFGDVITGLRMSFSSSRPSGNLRLSDTAFRPVRRAPVSSSGRPSTLTATWLAFGSSGRLSVSSTCPPLAAGSWPSAGACGRRSGLSAGSARLNEAGLGLGNSEVASWHAARHNPSLELTHSGMPRKPAVRQVEHRHTSGLRAMPPRSAQLERYAPRSRARQGRSECRSRVRSCRPPPRLRPPSATRQKKQ